MPTVEIYTQPWCPFCARAVNLLTRKGVPFTEINAPQGSPDRAKSVERSGRSSVPQVFIDGRHLGGCDDLMSLEREGKLDPMLKAA